EERPEDEVEEVDRRGREQRRTHDWRAEDVPRARRKSAAPLGVGRRLDRRDAAQGERRDEKRDRVGDERDGRGEQLHKEAAEARAADERERTAPVQKRVRLDVAFARHERDEEGAVRDVEQDAERSRDETGDVQLRQRQRVEGVRDRDRGKRRGASEIGHDHHLAAATASVDPGPGVQREEQIRKEFRRRQKAHLGRARMQDEHADERQGDQRDLVADERDRLAGEEAAKAAVLTQQPWHETRPRSGAGLHGHCARRTVTSPLIDVARSSTSGASSAGGSSPSSTSELKSPLIARASTQTLEPWRMPMLMSPDIDWTLTLPAVTAPIRWSPEAVLTSTTPPASSTDTSPDAARAESFPSTRPSLASPEAVLTSASPSTDDTRTSPLAASTRASPATSSKSISPDAALASSDPNRPRPRKSAVALSLRTLAP